MNHFILPPELEDLKPLTQWVCYRLVPDEKTGKMKKPPVNPMTGQGAKANDPTTWATFAQAEAAIQKYNLNGVGFEFANGYTGIDLDNVIDDNGELNALAIEIVEMLDSYTEYSPSKRGLHILVKTDLLPIGKKNDKIGLEIYNHSRYFTITGLVFGQSKPIQERTEQVKAILEKYIPEKINQKPVASVIPRVTNETTGEIWQKAFNNPKVGDRIRALYNGDLSGHGGDHSGADQALMNYLAFWTNGDPAKMDLMFRESGLMRPKWDEKHGVLTYGQKTIEKALENFTPYIPVEPQRKEEPLNPLPKNIEFDKIENDDFSIEKFMAESVDDWDKPIRVPEEPKKNIFAASSQPDGVRDYIYKEMGADLDRFQSFAYRKTGFENLDEITSLYPGLYVIGAISSLGKTTFVSQLGDQLALMGDHVLYFTLEQTRFELVTKSISRLTAKKTCFDNFSTAVSAINIRRGKVNDTVRKATKEYAEKYKNVSLIECSFDTTIDNILEYVEGYISANKGIKPVVIVDYLQIIRPADPRQTTKDAVDSHVRALKMLQGHNDLVVLVVCSLNRANYLMPIDFESYKESGGIEYTADVVWGLQLDVMNDNTFEDEKSNKKAKREAIKKAKLKYPRKIELVCLKNRYGKSSYSCKFDYFPMYDLFAPEDTIPCDFEPLENKIDF